MKLVAGTKQSRNPIRNQLLIFMLFRHGYPHMLRHSCRVYLVEQGHQQRMIQEYLSQASPESTTIYSHVPGNHNDK